MLRMKYQIVHFRKLNKPNYDKTMSTKQLLLTSETEKKNFADEYFQRSFRYSRRTLNDFFYIDVLLGT